MFSRTGYPAASVVSLLSGAAMYGAIVYLPFFFQGVQGKLPRTPASCFCH
ncbi:MAG: hypothetical protein ACE37B_01680 [Ilumatobacter sp.]